MGYGVKRAPVQAGRRERRRSASSVCIVLLYGMDGGRKLRGAPELLLEWLACTVNTCAGGTGMPVLPHGRMPTTVK